jgi:hypothetical protein
MAILATRAGAKREPELLARPRTARAIDLAIGERTDGPIFVTADGHRLDRHGAARIVRRPSWIRAAGGGCIGILLVGCAATAHLPVP